MAIVAAIFRRPTSINSTIRLRFSAEASPVSIGDAGRTARHPIVRRSAARRTWLVAAFGVRLARKVAHGIVIDAADDTVALVADIADGQSAEIRDAFEAQGCCGAEGCVFQGALVAEIARGDAVGAGLAVAACRDACFFREEREGEDVWLCVSVEVWAGSGPLLAVGLCDDKQSPLEKYNVESLKKFHC